MLKMRKRLMQLILFCLMACQTQHEDDVVPTPMISTQLLPDLPVHAINGIARHSKKVTLTVHIVDNLKCKVSDSLKYFRFELMHTKSGQIVKVLDPERYEFSWTDRLEDRALYRARLVRLAQEKEVNHYDFEASQQDEIIKLVLPCRG